MSIEMTSDTLKHMIERVGFGKIWPEISKHSTTMIERHLKDGSAGKRPILLLIRTAEHIGFRTGYVGAKWEGIGSLVLGGEQVEQPPFENRRKALRFCERAIKNRGQVNAQFLVMDIGKILRQSKRMASPCRAPYCTDLK